MTPAERTELETRADRCVRRGELSEALALYRSLCAAFPDEASLRQRLRNVEESLQPAELLSAKSNFAPEPTHAPASGHKKVGPEQEGERLFALGDFTGAMAAYRRALKEKPDSELISERLEELYRLARSAPRHSPTDSALPRDPQKLLSALLDRIASRRRI